MSEWISVKDRMPAHKSTVVILMEKDEATDEMARWLVHTERMKLAIGEE